MGHTVKTNSVHDRLENCCRDGTQSEMKYSDPNSGVRSVMAVLTLQQIPH